MTAFARSKSHTKFCALLLQARESESQQARGLFNFLLLCSGLIYHEEGSKAAFEQGAVVMGFMDAILSLVLPLCLSWAESVSLICDSYS